ncbi:hypothetical protein EAY32_03605, partial [Vibrio anguillarum]|nr:hypothetical protein [Vibrio anguillarum]
HVGVTTNFIISLPLINQLILMLNTFRNNLNIVTKWQFCLYLMNNGSSISSKNIPNSKNHPVIKITSEYALKDD